MLDVKKPRAWRGYVLALFGLLLAIAIPAGAVFAGISSFMPIGAGQSNQVDVGQSKTTGNDNSPVDVNAFLFLQPGTGGSCAPPANGGTTDVGCRFVLELMLNTGTNPIPNGATAQQTYMTYTHQLIKNARFDQIATACVITNTATLDGFTFDAVLQNEICNGGPAGINDAPCVFRGVSVAAGSFAFASGALSNCPEGCDGTFRVAQVAICAVAPGRALMHWQFTPPAPATRDTQIVRLDGELIHDPTLFSDYVINITGTGPTPTDTPTGGVATNTAIPTSSPTNTPAITNTTVRTNTPVSTNTTIPTNTTVRTNTPINTPAITNTPVRTNTPINTPVSTNTPVRTNTPVSTNTPARTNTTGPSPTRTLTPTITRTRTITATRTQGTVVPTNTRPPTNTRVPTRTPAGCSTCNLRVEYTAISCNTDSTVHWAGVVNNGGDCVVTAAAWRAELLVKGSRGGYQVVRTLNGSSRFGLGDTIIPGDFCFQFPADSRTMRVKFTINADERCDHSRNSHTLTPCNRTQGCQ